MMLFFLTCIVLSNFSLAILNKCLTCLNSNKDSRSSHNNHNSHTHSLQLECQGCRPLIHSLSFPNHPRQRCTEPLQVDDTPATVQQIIYLTRSSPLTEWQLTNSNMGYHQYQHHMGIHPWDGWVHLQICWQSMAVAKVLTNVVILHHFLVLFTPGTRHPLYLISLWGHP